MSFSTLSELQECPRRWALKAAEYPHVWGHRGYPRSPQAAALEGMVVHIALQTITQSLTDEGCPTLLDARAISVLRKLGGFTVIINSCLQRALRPYEENPRAAPVLEGIRRRLVAKVPEIRSRVQVLLSRICLEPNSDGRSRALIHRKGEARHPLSYGSYSEVELRVPELGWHGVADLLTLSRRSIEIRDFKTGAYKEGHESQLRTYALLWARDRDLNPSGRVADKLVISYDERDLQLPAPSESAFVPLEDDLRRQTAAAIAELQVNPPEARPKQDNCAYCSVRHLCEEYWQWLSSHEGGDQSPGGQFADIQIKLLSRHGPTSWDGVVRYSSAMKLDRPILLRTSNVPFDLQPGQEIRLLNVGLSMSTEGFTEGELSTAVATTGTSTEVFLV